MEMGVPLTTAAVPDGGDFAVAEPLVLLTIGAEATPEVESACAVAINSKITSEQGEQNFFI
jgi:hypothetical protein